MSSTGHHSKGVDIVLTWTVGEPVTSAWRGVDCRLTSGFHQGMIDHAVKPQPVAGVQIYPNPARAEVTVAINGYEQTRYPARVYNAQGAELKHVDLKPGTNRLSLADMQPGLLVCRIFKPDGALVATQKIIIY